VTSADFSTSVVAGRLVLAVSGEVDLANASQLEAALGELIGQSDGHPLVIDAGALTYIDSTGIRALMRAQRRYDHGTRIEIRGATPAVRRLLDLMVPGMFDVR
jgi:anti-anti-sigma factor